MDGEDFLEEPYSFGGCRSYDFTTKAHCNAFETPDKEIHVSVRKRGNWVTVVIPDILDDCGGTGDSSLAIDSFLPSELLGSNPRVRMFAGLGKNSAVLASKLETVSINIRMEKNGLIKIRPLSFFLKADGSIAKLNSFKHGQDLGEGAKIGTLAIQFTYVIDDEHQFDNNVLE